MQNKDNSLLAARYLTDQAILNDPANVYADEVRQFQGIPGIECTKGGRYYTVFYTGMHTEENGNFLLIHRSDDGVNFGKAIMAILPPTEDTRCYDPTLWMDPAGRLWIFWAQSYGWYDGRCGVWCAVCDHPDADDFHVREPRRIANGIMMNKPTVTKDGAWLLPCAIWGIENSEYNRIPEERFSNVYCSRDNGESFHLIGGADYPDRAFDEHMLYERADGSLVMLIRGRKDIGISYSRDGGVTWTKCEDSGLGSPNSRFCVRRLTSGRLLLVNHRTFRGRNNLTAMLSEDDGATWSEGLLLDERNDVSYPDMAESPDGFINIIYDYNRYSDKEILLAHITEDDILAGQLINSASAIKCLVNKATGGEQ